MTDIIWLIEKRSVMSLVLWDRNPRTISKESFERLVGRIRKRGMHDIIKIDIDGTILSGNQRKVALQELCIEEVYVLVPNRKLTEQEREQVAIESNMSDGQWNYDELANIDEATLLDLGWGSEELDKIFQLDIEDDDFDTDAEYKKITKPKVKLGDLYVIGGEIKCPKCQKVNKL